MRKEWYYASDGNPQGPGTTKKIVSLESETLVWRPGFPAWVRREEVQHLMLFPKDTPGTIEVIDAPAETSPSPAPASQGQLGNGLTIGSAKE